MAYAGNITEILFGRAGMTARENRLLTSPDELLDANEVTFEDDLIRKGPGGLLMDPNGVAGVPGYTGTLSASATWIAGLVAFPGSGIAAGGTTVTGTKAVANTVCVLTTPVGGYALGSLVVVSAHGTLAPDSVLDAAGNTYTLIRSVQGVSNVSIWASILTTSLTAGQVIQATYLTNPNFLAVGVAANFTGVTSLTGPTAGKTGTGTAVSVAMSVPVTVPALLIAGVTNTAAASSTPGSSFTELADLANGGALRGILNFRIDTTTPTIIGLHDWRSDVDTAPAGTVSTTAGDATVTGVGTSFNGHAPGDKIVIAGEQKVILSIASNTSLETTETWLATNAGVTYRQRSGPRIITATSEGNLYKDKPAALTTTNLDAVTLETGLSRFARPGRFIQAGKEAAALPRKLFYFNGADQVHVLSGDGTTTAPIATPPADWDTANNPFKQPVNGVVHNNRLAAWGNLNDPHRIYFSNPDDHEDFTGTGSFNMRFGSHIGDRLMCGVSYSGVLVVWKYPNGIFYLDDVDLTPTNWFVRTKSEALGCAPSPYAALPIDDDVLFLSATGAFHMLSAVDTLGGLRASDLSYALGISKWLRDNVNLGKLSQVVSVWYPHKKVALFGVPSAGSLENDLLLKFDFGGKQDGKPVRFSYAQTFAPGGLALKFDHTDQIERPIVGEAGTVYLMDQEARAKDTDGYTSSFRTPNLDLAQLDPTLRTQRKQWDHLELIMNPVALGTLTVEIYVDDVLRQTIAHYSPTLKRERFKLNCGDGYTLSVKVTSPDTVNADFEILGMTLYWRRGNEDQSR